MRSRRRRSRRLRLSGRKTKAPNLSGRDTRTPPSGVQITRIFFSVVPGMSAPFPPHIGTLRRQFCTDCSDPGLQRMRRVASTQLALWPCVSLVGDTDSSKLFFISRFAGLAPSVLHRWQQPRASPIEENSVYPLGLLSLRSALYSRLEVQKTVFRNTPLALRRDGGTEVCFFPPNES